MRPTAGSFDLEQLISELEGGQSPIYEYPGSTETQAIVTEDPINRTNTNRRRGNQPSNGKIRPFSRVAQDS